MKKKLFFLVVLLVTMVAGAWGAGFTRTLTGNLEVTGYELKAFYDFQTNTPAVLPTEGDLCYRDGNVWGLHNFKSGPRTAEVQIPVSEGNLLILQNYTDYTSSIDCGTEDAELSASTGYQVFKITSNANSINITVPRYGGVVAALVMKVTGSEEAELPNLNDYELVKSVTWGGDTDLTRATDAMALQTYNSENKVMSAVFPLTAPEEAAGWIAVQGTNSQDTKGWWNRASNGLWSYNATRCAAVYGDDLTTGWLIVFECTQDPAAVMTLTNKDGMPDGTFTYVKDVKNYYCTINAASNAYVGFCGIKSVGYISKISVYKPKSAVVEDAEITKVELQGNFATTGTEWNAVSLTEQSDNVYSGVLDLTGYTDDKSFKLVVNDGGSESDGYAGWIGTNNVTVDAPEGWVVSTSETDNGNLTLNNSQTGYQTYTVTATWEPNVDYYKGWSLKIEGKDARKYAVSVADGITNGTVTVDKTEAAEGEEVTVTATPADGYELDAITVTGSTSNQAVTVTEGKFTMIADAVTVSATFQGESTDFHYEKATSIDVGDVVLFTNVDAKQELKGIEMFGQNSIGAVQGYEGDTPAAVYPLTVVEGSTADAVSYAFKTADGQYLAWTAGNTLFASDEVNENSSWTVSFTDGVATIVNGADNTRKLQYNATSPRFCAYTSAQKPVTLWKKVAGAAPAPAVAAPVIEGETPFVGSTTVTITCETQDASIYYTTDGTDPTNESTAYVEPFELTATATVKAIAYDVTGANSDVASKEFVATPTVANIAALNALENGTTFAYTGEALVVAKAANENKTYVYIKDETGSSLIYDADASKTEAAVVGKTIAANWTGKVTVYKNLFEAVPDAALSVKDGEAVEVTYPEAQLTDVVADNVSQVVELKGVTYTLDGKSLTISQGQAETAGYNQFGMEIAAAEEGKTYNIVGAIGRYNDNIQFWPISIEEAQTEPAPLYIIGDMNGWTRTNMTQMEFNAETQAYEYSFTNENEFATFAFATYQMTEEEAAADPQWETFNAEYRWDIGAGDVDATDYVNGDAVQLVKGVDGTVKLPKGTYTVSVDPETMMMTITGIIAPGETFEYDAVYVAGNGTEGSAWMNGVTWNPLAEDNKMTKVDGTDDVWEITFKDVPASSGDEGYQLKFIPSGQWSADESTTWSVNFGGDFIGYGIETPAAFNSSNNIVFTTTAEQQDITLRIDLSNYNPTTNEGATFTVIAPKEQNTYVVAGCVGEKSSGEDDLLFGKAWDGAAEANQLAYDETSKLFTKTYEAVAFEGAADIFYKIVINGKRWVPDGENLTCEIPAADTYDITVTYDAETGEATMTATLTPVDIVINPEDITGGDITAAIAAKTEGKTVKNLTINLAAGEAYTLSKTITAPNNLVLKGDDKNPATITLAADMTDNVITLDGTKAVAKKSDGTDSDHKLIASVEIIGVKILGLQAALIKDTQKTLLETLTISDAIVEMPAAGKNVLDFNSKGYVGKVIVKNSTIYAKGKNTGFFAQYGSRPKNVNGDWLQEFDVQNSTIVNIANGKNFCDLKQNGTAQNVYTLKNNIFADCGKQNQVVVGFNKGQASATPVWDVDANVFNWGGADVSAAETTSAGKKAEEDIVKNSHAGVITFTDAANGDFNGVFTAEPVKEEPAVEAASRRAGEVAATLSCGDPRWTIEQKQGQAITIADNIKHGSIKADKIYAAEGEAVKITATPDENFALDKIIVQGVNTDLEVEVTIDPQNPNVGTFIMPADAVIVRAMFKYVIPAGTHILNINDIYAAAKAKTSPCENATANSETKYLLNDATIEMDIFTVVSKSDRTYRIDASTDVDYGDYDSWSRLEPNGTSNKTGGRQMFIDVPEGGGVLYIGAHGAAGRALYVTKAADKTSFVDLSKVAEADVMLKHAFVAGETSPADYNVYKVQLAAGLYCITQDNGIYFTYVKFVEGETYTAPAIDVDALKAEIAAAKKLLGKDDVTVNPGKALNDAITAATDALKAVNAETTQETVDKAVTDLQAAEEAYKLAIAKSELSDEIAKATELLGEASTDAGTPGADLKKAIDDAQAVFDSTESTLENVNKAIEDLQAAEEAYNMATGIDGVNASKYADGEWYTTGGVRVDKPTKKGLYIHNGRKVVIK